MYYSAYSQKVSIMPRHKKKIPKQRKDAWDYAKFVSWLEDVRRTGNINVYNLVQPGDIINAGSIVKFNCGYCGMYNEHTVNSHCNNGQKCECQSRTARKTYNVWINRFREKFGPKFDYIEIRPWDVVNQYSVCNITCFDCGTRFQQSLGGHYRSKIGCIVCAEKDEWTKIRLEKEGFEKHEGRVTYELITEDMMNGKDGKLPMSCVRCGKPFMQSPHCHITGSCGCPKCAIDLREDRWTWLRLRKNSDEVHGEDEYLFDDNDENDEIKVNKKVKITHVRCGMKFEQTPGGHIHSKRGCSCNRASHGEKAIIRYLRSKNIQYQTEFILPNLARKRYDFRIGSLNGQKYLIEFDGEQHFKHIPYFHNVDSFERLKQTDLTKSVEAVRSGYILVRVDYNSINRIKKILDFVFGEFPTRKYYLTNPTLYKDHYTLLDVYIAEPNHHNL